MTTINFITITEIISTVAITTTIIIIIISMRGFYMEVRGRTPPSKEAVDHRAAQTNAGTTARTGSDQEHPGMNEWVSGGGSEWVNEWVSDLVCEWHTPKIFPRKWNTWQNLSLQAVRTFRGFRRKRNEDSRNSWSSRRGRGPTCSRKPLRSGMPRITLYPERGTSWLKTMDDMAMEETAVTCHSRGSKLKRWIDGWVDGWVGGWMGGLVDGWVGGWVGWWMDGWVDGWVGGWMGGLVDGWVGILKVVVLSCHCCHSLIIMQ